MENKHVFLNHLGQTTEHPLLIEVDSAEGIYIIDKKGKRYMDMISGLCVNNLGHNFPSIQVAIKDQLDRHSHVMVYGEFVQDAQLDLARELGTLLPKNLDCIYPLNSGTEANEAAIKLCKSYTKRTEIIAFNGAYHGSSNGSLSISSNKARKKTFEPLLPNIRFIDVNQVDQLNAITEKTAGVFLETVQGDAGVIIPSQEFMLKLRDKCLSTGALLVLDEIQCGLGRTGKHFAFEHFNIEPDILTLGKSLGGGLPIGALISKKNVLQAFSSNPALGHITTFGGHPVTCAAAAAFCKALKTNINLKETERLGHLLAKKISAHPAILNYRYIGMMFAFDMESPEKVSKVVHRCLEKGVISFWFLSHPNSFRLSPPLIISEQEIETAGELIYEAIDESIL
jgi:acetylornithine/succinyldiaminopimelate/putrescine aminotransferase